MLHSFQAQKSNSHLQVSPNKEAEEPGLLNWENCYEYLNLDNAMSI
jgi:hypothetical protein